jgi:hypothetical protein
MGSHMTDNTISPIRCVFTAFPCALVHNH